MRNEEQIRQKISGALVDYRTTHGLTQEEMADILYPHNISLSAYRRAERGLNNVSIPKLITILDALNIDMLHIPINENAVLLSRIGNEDQIDYYQSIINQFFYSKNFPSCLDLRYRKLLFLFVLYLPLIPGTVLQDILYRIGGNIIDHESYFFDQITKAIDCVPETAAKTFADKISERILHLSADDAVEFHKSKESDISDDIKSLKEGKLIDEYNEYCNAIRERFDVKEWLKCI